MNIKEYVEIFKKTYKAKEIEFKDITKYCSRPDMYGENFDIETVSEDEIYSDNFVTLVIKGSNLDENGKFDWGTTAIMVFAEFDDQKEVINACTISELYVQRQRSNVKILQNAKYL